MNKIRFFIADKLFNLILFLVPQDANEAKNLAKLIKLCFRYDRFGLDVALKKTFQAGYDRAIWEEYETGYQEEPPEFEEWYRNTMNSK